MPTTVAYATILAPRPMLSALRIPRVPTVAEHDATAENFADAAVAAGPSPPRATPWHVALRVVRDVEGPSMRAKQLSSSRAKHSDGAKQDDTTTYHRPDANPARSPRLF